MFSSSILKQNILFFFIVTFTYICNIQSQNNNGTLDQIEELGSKVSVPIRLPGGPKLSTDLYLPITSDSLVFGTTILGQTISLELIPKGTQIVVYPEMIDSSGNAIPNPNPYQLPLILSRTPYGKNALGTIGNVIPILGYAFANQDVRGKGESDGVYLPMYSDSWQKSPYHNFNHLLDISNPTDSFNGRFHEDGWSVYQFLLNDLKKDYDLDGDGISETNATICNGTMGMLGASAFAIPHFQLMASNNIDPSSTVPGMKGNLSIIATAEHYNTTGFHNGVFRQGLVGKWLEKEMVEIQNNSGNDNDLNNNIHTPSDFGLNTKAEVIDHAIKHYTTYQYPGTSMANAYPNSIGRAEMDVSYAFINANGTGDPLDSISRYNNMNVPTYHLSGWYDIFVDGQIRTWNNLKKHTNTKQKMVIGPWAHFTTTMSTSGDVTYPPQASQLLGFDGTGLNFTNIGSLDLSTILGIEPIEFLRYTLNTNGYVKLGKPVIRIPESNKWQGTTLKVRIPSENYDLTLVQLINFLGGQGSLPSIPIEAKLGILPAVNINIPFPNFPGLLPTLPFTLSQPMIEPKEIDFDTIPNIRFYVIGPLDSLSGNENAGNYWFSSDTLPLTQGVQYASFYLHQNGIIDQKRPIDNEGTLSYIHDPENPVRTVGGNNLFIENPDGSSSHGQMDLTDSLIVDSTLLHPGVLQFETTVLTDTFCIIGFPKATIFAKSTPQGIISGETSTDFMVRIIDVYPDGKEYYVIEGSVNARAREYARSIYNDNENPDLAYANIQVDQIYEYQFNLLPIAYTFGKEHKMKILISSSNYPRYMSNPNIPIEDGDFFRTRPNDGQTYIYQGQTYSPRIAENSIFFSDSLASKIDFPIYGNNPHVQIDRIVDLNKNNTLKIQPNPTSDFLTITRKDISSGIISIYDNLGRLVIQSFMNEIQLRLNVKHLTKGIYRLCYVDEFSGKHEVSSFIKN